MLIAAVVAGVLVIFQAWLGGQVVIQQLARRARHRPPGHGADRAGAHPGDRRSGRQRRPAASGRRVADAARGLDRRCRLRADAARLVGHRQRLGARLRRLPAHERHAPAEHHHRRAGGPAGASRAGRDRRGAGDLDLAAGAPQHRRPRDRAGSPRLGAGLVAVQLLLGAANVWSRLSALFVVPHLAVGAALWATMVLLYLAIRRLPMPEVAPQGRAPGRSSPSRAPRPPATPCAPTSRSPSRASSSCCW